MSDDPALFAAQVVEGLKQAGVKMIDDDNFDWSIDNKDVILPEQRTTAVYVNRWGQAVLRQERNWDEEDDPFMTIDHANLPAIIARLQEIADKPRDRDEPNAGKATRGK